MSRPAILHTRPLRALSFVLLACRLTLVPAVARAEGNMNFVYGQRSLDEDFWDPTDDQKVLGGTLDFGGKDWPVHIAAGYYKSDDEGTLNSFPILGSVDLDAEVSEWSLGIHKVWKAGIVRPYVGGGVSFVSTDAKVTSNLGNVSDDDDTTGIYVQGGVFWRLGEWFNLGFDARLLEGTDVTLFDMDGDADYWQIGALVGFGWP
ncbi:MAG TPA: outer membrane beta-barrel protein [Candidatus Polarisedimenticolia bacterium]|nr:outer membrane beta-barrel protein [Candidatus Polarisedimenticolia bacterium]